MTPVLAHYFLWTRTLQYAPFSYTTQAFRRQAYMLWASWYMTGWPRYSNAGRFVTNGAIVAGGHQISFAQANHHRTAGPRVSLQVGLSFYYLSSWCVATSAATKPAALQHTIWYYIGFVSQPCLHTSQPRSLLPMAEQVNTAWFPRHQSALGGSGQCSEVRTLMLDCNQKVLLHPQATLLSCTYTIQVLTWGRLER